MSRCIPVFFCLFCLSCTATDHHTPQPIKSAAPEVDSSSVDRSIKDIESTLSSSSSRTERIISLIDSLKFKSAHE